MAIRPVFIPIETSPFFKQENIEFQFYSGFSDTQKQKSIKSLHSAYLEKYPNNRVLEISTKSYDELGINLSAFNLNIKTESGNTYSVESAFQSSKVFENGGPYSELIYKQSREAKKDPRLRESGKLIYFYFNRRKFDIIPRTFFYNWLYINTLNLYPDYSEKVMDYNAFTDIEFNPDRSINCQAMAAAIFTSLYKLKLLNDVRNADSFLNIVYKYNISIESTENKQMNFFE